MRGGQSIPIGVSVLHIPPSSDLRDFIIEPIHSIIYVIFILLACGLFSKTWVELSGKSSRDVAKNLRDNQYFLKSIIENEENIYEYFNKTIPDTYRAFDNICWLYGSARFEAEREYY